MTMHYNKTYMNVSGSRLTTGSSCCVKQNFPEGMMVHKPSLPASPENTRGHSKGVENRDKGCRVPECIGVLCS